MASRKELLEITYHDDDDTGMYGVGEVDFGIHGTLDNFLKSFGREGKDDIISTLLNKNMDEDLEELDSEPDECEDCGFPLDFCECADERIFNLRGGEEIQGIKSISCWAN